MLKGAIYMEYQVHLVANDFDRRFVVLGNTVDEVVQSVYSHAWEAMAEQDIDVCIAYITTATGRINIAILDEREKHAKIYDQVMT
jgi:hypothetical protein